MSNADKDSPTDPAEETNPSVTGKAKQAASDIDVDALKGRAKEVADDVKDKSVTAASTASHKVRGFVGTNETKIGGAIDRTSEFVDQKLTRQKFSDKIGKASNAAKGAVNKVGEANDSDIAEAEIVDEDEGPKKPPQSGTADET